MTEQQTAAVIALITFGAYAAYLGYEYGKREGHKEAHRADLYADLANRLAELELANEGKAVQQ